MKENDLNDRHKPLESHSRHPAHMLCSRLSE